MPGDGYPGPPITWEQLSKIKLPTGPALPSRSDATEWPEDLIIEEPDGSRLWIGVVLGEGGRPRLAFERRRNMNSGSAVDTTGSISLTTEWSEQP